MHRTFRISLLVLASLAGLSAAPAFATEAQCKFGGGFQVISRARTEAPGDEIIARAVPASAAGPCIFSKRAGDIEISTVDEADTVLGLAGAHLVMDRGTGPSRDLVIYDLAARKVALTLPYDDKEPVKITASGVTLAAVTGPASAATCPKFKEYKANGLGAVLTIETRIAFPGLARSQSGKPRCIAQQ
ncbi:MAG TPA: hypothetical protein PK706_26730 [Xanthobacteraceae bacterium]|jgi:hypothetical protein|nr:MAG: hypothetical protein B7Y61_09175 [Rhizobiales bacterium 35-66-30]OZA98322.1 MAG: hypothetical protein B7X67_22220 [Rhizobiales bacterium 39-66-18]HQS49999.1 hypothetical protein [Xanthobacteraceae bacterium]